MTYKEKERAIGYFIDEYLTPPRQQFPVKTIRWLDNYQGRLKLFIKSADVPDNLVQKIRDMGISRDFFNKMGYNLLTGDGGN